MQPAEPGEEEAAEAAEDLEAREPAADLPEEDSGDEAAEVQEPSPQPAGEPSPAACFGTLTRSGGSSERLLSIASFGTLRLRK